MIEFFISFLTIIEVITALLIIVVILMQRSKSGGGLGAIGGGATEEVFGSSYGNVLSKTTVILSSFFLITTLVLAVLQGNAIKSQGISIVESVEDAEEPQLKSIAGDEPKNADQNIGPEVDTLVDLEKELEEAAVQEIESKNGSKEEEPPVSKEETTVEETQDTTKEQKSGDIPQ